MGAKFLSSLSNIMKPDYLRVGAELVLERINSRLQAGPLWWFRFVGRTSERLLFTPSCIRPSDPLVARDIYQGRFTFSGRTVETGATSVFDVEAPSPAWENGLHSFRWLRHLSAADTELASENARALIDGWLNGPGKRIIGVSWEADICAARLIAWLQHAPFILRNSEHSFYRRFLASINKQMRYLRAFARGCQDDLKLLKVRIALAMCSLVLTSHDKTRTRAARNLEYQLKRQIYTDGGHVSRNPDAIADILCELLPLSQLYIAASKPVPSELLRAIDRLFPMLRFFRHADGSIAQFHGAGIGDADISAAVLRHDVTNGQPNGIANQSGYQKLVENDAVVIADIGRPVAGYNGVKTHASTLAFEFSSGRNRLIVNAGVDRLCRDVYDAPARATAAHSALVLDDKSSAQFAVFSSGRRRHTRLLRGPTVVETQPWKTENGEGFSARHNGYLPTSGLWHERGILLAHSGRRLDGYDRLTPESAIHKTSHKADIRFHLHPSIQVAEVGDYLQIKTDRGEVWQFSAVNQKPMIEQSIFLAGISGPIYNWQIVISFEYPGVDSVKWRFERI